MFRRISAGIVLTFFLLGAYLMQSQSGAYAQTKTSLARLEEFHQRGGLPNFFQKVKEGREVKVAYIGGSITEAGEGWRTLTYNWLRIHFPHTPFTEINATIGGTGSNLGVFRMERDVLAYQPDLVFVEFAVNDAGRSAAQLHQSMEGIVRKTWKANPNTEICFVYTVSENVLQNLLDGQYQPSAQAMETIAEYYQIPSIHMGVEVARLQKEGKLIFTGKPEEHPGKIVFTTDKVHPLSKSGHPVYASVVRKYFEVMEKKAGNQSHRLDKPFVSDNWEGGQLLALPDQSPSAHWQKLPADHELVKSFAKFMPTIYGAVTPEATLRLQFKGTTLGFYDLIGPGSGLLEVTLDGEKKEVQRFDQWGNSYRKSSFYLEGLPDGVHEITIRVPGTAFDKASILQKRNITIDNPSRYAENGWYLGNILLVGALLDSKWE
ncbi:SGNH/GDSL hydrolase family protein [Tellurirhabdus bombi]|uniref:SGNH/GDSL hydrolase family protein n=1 Tax=Tellurirhabdus bombi TaxID=2907205 RepID=UPI001F3F5769|nr:GDSL-type esterase/lipase family protein [Tellurirhabdus bombi]